MNRYITKNGVTIHEYTKPRYNLYQMYLDAEDRSPELTILEAWYNGEFGEITAVNKLKRLGLIGEDKYIEVTIKPAVLHTAIHKIKEGGWKKYHG